MAATVAFADPENLAGAGFPNVSEIEDQQCPALWNYASGCR